jgi:hypothetical protein
MLWAESAMLCRLCRPRGNNIAGFFYWDTGYGMRDTGYGTWYLALGFAADCRSASGAAVPGHVEFGGGAAFGALATAVIFCRGVGVGVAGELLDGGQVDAGVE